MSALAMTDHSGWYPPSQVCYPPELPTYLKTVYELKPIVGVPSHDEVVGIHAVIQAATKVSSVPGMHDPDLFRKLADHLFSVQMLVYRNKYTSLMFPTDVTYTPPALPAHVPANLEPISCTPSDEEVTKVQDAIRTYQKYSEIPSMFEPQVSAELSQHLFDIQMARYMCRAAQQQPNPPPQENIQPRNLTGIATNMAEENSAHSMSNNAGTGAESMESHHLQNTAIQEILERSNQLVERANELSERSNQLIERSNQISERTNQLIERPDHPAEQSNQTADQPSTDNLVERFNELIGRLNQHLEHSNQLAAGFKTPVEQIGDALKTINKVLVGVQHAIVRSRKGVPVYSILSLINEKGECPLETTWPWSPMATGGKVNTFMGGQSTQWSISDENVVYYLRFYGLEGDFFEDPEKTQLLPEKKFDARKKLGQFLTSALA